MRERSRCLRVSTIVFLGTIAMFAQEKNTTPRSETEPPAVVNPMSAASNDESATHETPAEWFENSFWKPVTHFFTSLAPIPVPEPERTDAPPVSPFDPQPGCSIAPLGTITDPAAKELEADNSQGGAIDTKDMMPAAVHALDLFETRISNLGGSLVLHSAFRPETYQRHLQDVWYKWMELKSNAIPACQGLRAAVQAEFLHHRLLESQHPVAVSDHTRGLAFDATVDLPKNAKVGRRKATVDLLARLAGLVRPALVADPVHFKFLGGMPRVHILTAARRLAPGRRLISARRVRNG